LINDKNASLAAVYYEMRKPLPIMQGLQEAASSQLIKAKGVDKSLDEEKAKKLRHGKKSCR